MSDRLAKLTQGQGVSAGRSVESLSVGAEKERGSVDALRLENESERTKDKHMQNVRRNVNGRARPTRSQTAPLDAFPTPPTATSTPPPSKSSNTTTHSTTSSPPSPTFSRTTRRSFTVPNGAVFDLTDEGAPPIVPRRIRERSPPPAFSVTSRPISQMSAGSGSVTGVMGGGSNAKGTVQHTHNSSTSTIRMLGGSVIAGGATTGGAMGNGTRDTQGKFVSSSSGPLPSTSGSPTTSTSSSSSSSSYSSSFKNPATLPPPPPSQPPIPSMVKSTLAPPGNTQPILRAPPPRTSSRPRAASSSLIPYGGKKPPETEGFTGGGLVATIVPERANGKGKRGGAPSAGRVGGSLSVSGNLNGGVSSNVNGVNSNANAGGVKTRGRSSTTIPMLDVGLDVGPSLSKAISDYSSVSGSGSNSRRGAGGGNSRSSSAMDSQPHPILVNSNTNPKTNNSNPRISSSSARPSSTATSALPYMIPSPSSGIPPPKPFAGGMRGNSPASSTGDSSSGRTPLTPADGSELGSAYSSSARGVAASSRGGGGGGGRSEVGKRNGASGGKREEGSVVSSATGGKGHRKSGSVGFQESERDRERDRDRGRGNVGGGGEEERRKERRRSEARAAIEVCFLPSLSQFFNDLIITIFSLFLFLLDASTLPLMLSSAYNIQLGNVVNGRGPIANDDDDEDLPLNTMGPRMSIVNPMFNLTPPSPMSWRPPSAVLPPQSYMFPVPPSNSDPSFLAAHQQAMMVAKQAYQIAVAQQAMAQANEEWERGSTATSAAFGGSVTGYGGMGGVPMGMGMPGMQGMGGMSPAAGGIFPGYGMGMQAGWPNGMMFPTSAQSMYAASMVGGGGSEMGGNMSTVGNAGGWGTRSEYGGPSVNRSSGVYRNSGIGFGQMGMGMGMHGGMHGGSAQSHYGPLESGGGGGRREGPRPRTKTAPSAKQGAVPPSSWKSNPQRRV